MTITDDGPLAVNDIDEVIAGGSTGGNVFTGDDDDGTDLLEADTIGADGEATPAVVTGVVAGTGTPVGANVDSEITGSFGKLTLNGDGSYTYVADSGITSPQVDVFTYEITDGDGDTATATLTINVGPPLNILDVSLVTNTNNTVQFLLLTFTELDGSGNPTANTFTTVIALTAEGQQKNFVFAFDVGFDIDPAKQHDLSLQYLGNDAGTADHINVTNFFVENVEIVPSQGGNIQIGNQGAFADGVEATFAPNAVTQVQATEFNLAVNSPQGSDGVNDVLTGTSGDDIIDGGTGNDTISGLAGADLLIGGDGNDILNGGDGSDVLIGGPGNDILDGGDAVGIDTVDYSSSPAGVNVNLSGAMASGQAARTASDGFGGTDTFVVDGLVNTVENVIGSPFADTLTGDDENNLLSGLGGIDILTGNGGNDLLVGGAGDDDLFGGAGDDALLGGDGSDDLFGGADDDTLVGGDGDDILVGGGGSDSLTGGKNADTYTFLSADLGDGEDTVFGFKFSDNDLLNIADVIDGTDGDGLSLFDLVDQGFLILDSTGDVGGGSAFDTVIGVDADGSSVGGSVFVTLVTVQDITLDSGDGSSFIV